jgi:hypothetical protein
MLELTGFGSVLRGIGLLYWVLAIGAVFLAIRYGKGTRGKVIWAVVALAAFGYLPGKALIEQHQRDTYAKEAWAYFKKLCDEKSGEKIYKTYTGVKSVLVVKPLPPATEKDLYDQFWYGDPYSDDLPGEDRSDRAAANLVGGRQFVTEYSYADSGYGFIELRVEKEGNWNFQRMTPLTAPPFVTKTGILKPESRFGISWEDISTPDDRKYWVAGSRLRVLDLTDNSVVAERIGFFIEAGFGSTAGQRRPWQTSRGHNTTCPAIISRDHMNRFFILKVLLPSEGVVNGK